MTFTTLIDTDSLAAHLTDESFRLVDCRFALNDPPWGEQVYTASHIPGAVYADLNRHLAGRPTGVNGRHPLPRVEDLRQTLSNLGIDRERQVVAYDQDTGIFASRLWWLLRWLGHDAVAVLDGGLGKWLRESRPMTSEAPRVTPRRFTPKPRPYGVDAAFVAAHLRDTALRLFDARSPDRYRGENETLDPVAGHVPGAINRFFRDNLAPDGAFKSPIELSAEWRARLGGASSAQTVHMCGSGVTACHNLLALEIAGLPGGRLYAGSWSEWCADPARPVATGDAP